jgi:outer membrane protein assembly factor BamA
MKYSILLLALLSAVPELWAQAAGPHPSPAKATGLGTPERLHLVKIVVTGSKRYAQEDLVRATGLAVNTRVTQDDLQNAANRLGTSGAFASVQFVFKPATGIRGVEADFTVTDAAQFLPTTFDNFVWFSDSELQSLVHQAVPLFDGTVAASGTMADEVKAAVANILTGRKLPAEVSYMMAAEMGRPPSACRFKVENAGLKVSAFHFAGATRVPTETLARSLEFLVGQEYSHSVTEEGLTSNLRPLYMERGFLKFKVEGFQAQLDGGSVVVEVKLAEGRQYALGGYRWAGNSLIPGEELSKLITVKQGQPLDFARLEDDLGRARKAFYKFGREAVSIKPVPEFSADSVSYTFEVTEGELFRMGRVEITGVDGETARKMAESWKLAEGQPYDNTYYLKFIASFAYRNGRQVEWMVAEAVDYERKKVNVRIELKRR